ncbi:MAG TPA: hypothetical protein VFA90_10195 [Terriglobales bacterium]|nr:hypothetical protein [Terriglobales bacterium]
MDVHRRLYLRKTKFLLNLIWQHQVEKMDSSAAPQLRCRLTSREYATNFMDILQLGRDIAWFFRNTGV